MRCSFPTLAGPQRISKLTELSVVSIAPEYTAVTWTSLSPYPNDKGTWKIPFCTLKSPNLPSLMNTSTSGAEVVPTTVSRLPWVLTNPAGVRIFKSPANVAKSGVREKTNMAITTLCIINKGQSPVNPWALPYQSNKSVSLGKPILSYQYGTPNTVGSWRHFPI